MNIVETQMRAVVSDHIRPFLNEHGFKCRQGNMFIRNNGDACWRLGVRLTKDAQIDYGEILPTVCVGFRSLARLLQDCPFPLIEDGENPCIMGTDLGHLMPAHQYRTWKVSPHTRSEDLGKELVSAIALHGLQFFENFGVLDKAVRAWESGLAHNLGVHRDFYLATAYSVEGRHEEALALIDRRLREFEKEYSLTHRSDDRIEKERFSTFLEFLQGKDLAGGARFLT